ncbi:hypothetical protein LX69_03455 [Breznakibacter xylanolyticus]|uniref:Uncharacterized protein n=1 Tax=Breznakibacter xylanolyticus TaxID=990 RepID=A0A2W7MZT3_9BACT|nr:hypothetical protein LX69_03455 [Breznakibacter xylanolyticus]
MSKIYFLSGHMELANGHPTVCHGSFHVFIISPLIPQRGTWSMFRHLFKCYVCTFVLFSCTLTLMQSNTSSYFQLSIVMKISGQTFAQPFGQCLPVAGKDETLLITIILNIAQFNKHRNGMSVLYLVKVTR